MMHSLLPLMPKMQYDKISFLYLEKLAELPFKIIYQNNDLYIVR